MVTKELTIINKLGLHARPAAIISEAVVNAGVPFGLQLFRVFQRALFPPPSHVCADSPATPPAEVPFLYNFSLLVAQKGAEIQDWDNQWWVDPAEGGPRPGAADADGGALAAVEGGGDRAMTKLEY